MKSSVIIVPPHKCLYFGPALFWIWAIHGWAPSGAQVPFKILNKGVKDFGLEELIFVSIFDSLRACLLILRYDFFSTTNFVEIVKTSLPHIWFLSDCFWSPLTSHQFHWKNDGSCKKKNVLSDPNQNLKFLLAVALKIRIPDSDSCS